jgi:hypothetical protein
MDERVVKWLRTNIGEIFDSPRRKAFDKPTQRFEVVSIVEESVRIRFAKSHYPALPLCFWMFDRTQKYLQENKGRAVRLGAKLTPPYESDTVEGQIWKKPYPTGNASYKASPHVCDILALAGLVEYVLVLKPETLRKVQGVKLLDNK